jgi:hypothetical protein
VRVRYRPLAARELVDTARWYDDREPGSALGADFIADVAATALGVAAGTRTGVRIAKLSASVDVRHVVMVGRFRYALVVVLQPEWLVVIAVSHGRRRPRYWQERLKDL